MIGARVLGAGALAVSLWVGHVVTSELDINAVNTDPFFEAGEVGRVVHLTYADVEVTDVRPAHYLAPQISNDLATVAGGVYVVVVVRFTAGRAPTVLNENYLVDDHGRHYLSSARAGCASAVPGRTGVPAYAAYCYDVPSSRLEGLRFRVGRGNAILGGSRGDDMADVDLGIDEDTAETWAATTDVYLAESTSEKPIELQTVTLNEQGDS